MSNINRKICRLCLGICDDDFDSIDEITKNMLDALLKLNLEISVEPIMCNECAKNLQESFDFKLACLGMNNKSLQFGNSTDNDGRECNVSEDYKVCQFCKNRTKENCLTALYEPKENSSILNRLQIYLPELILNICDELVACKNCLKSVHILFNFVANCLDVEAKIMKYVDIKGTSDKCRIELNEVQQFTATDIKNDVVVGQVSTNLVKIKKEKDNHEIEEVVVKQEIENVNFSEIDATECNIKDEDTEIKIERIDNISCLDPATSKSRTSKNIHECKLCAYKTKNKTRLKNHMIAHRDQPEITWHKCTQFPFQTKHKVSLKTHSLVHKVSSEVKIFRCHNCSYETKHKGNLIKHMVIHTDATKLTTYKCDKCEFETKHKNYLYTHKSVHSFIVFQCDQCIFMTNSKCAMKRHMLRHRGFNKNDQKFSCDICPYTVKSKRSFKAHVATIHANDVTLFKCDLCPYTSKVRRTLQAHIRSHKITSEGTMYKCHNCPYETKYKNCITQHINRKHRTRSEVTLYKCKMCAFETLYGGSLKKHEMTHKDRSEMVMHKCEWCVYESRDKWNLKKHMLTHRIHNPIYKNAYD